MAQLFNQTIKKAPDGKLHDGRGLMLVKKGDTGQWFFRYSLHARRREMGLGSWPIVTLADARKARDKWAAVLAAGNDPIDTRKAEREGTQASHEPRDPTFAELVDVVFESKKASLRGEGTRGRWRSPIDLYLIPAFGNKPGSAITQRDIVAALQPIWKKKYPTAIRSIQRVRIVLRSAKLMGFPTDPDIVNSAQEILGVVRHKVQHTAFVHWRDIPELYASLPDTAGGNCNRWMILTLVRLSGCRGARVTEIDFDSKIWTVPHDRIKGRQGMVEDFRVPMPEPLLDLARLSQDTGLNMLFPGQRGTKPITDVGVEQSLKGCTSAGTPHGFRTSFRTWVQDTQACSWEVAEMVLGHKIGGIIERSYARSDLLDQRRIVMNKWSNFVHSIASR